MPNRSRARWIVVFALAAVFASGASATTPTRCGLLVARLEIGDPAPNGGIDRERLTLRLIA